MIGGMRMILEMRKDTTTGALCTKLQTSYKVKIDGSYRTVGNMANSVFRNGVEVSFSKLVTAHCNSPRRNFGDIKVVEYLETNNFSK